MRRKYECNHDYFSKWSSNMAYILGFISADGNVYKNSVRIDLQPRDISVLNFIRLNISPKSKIEIKHKGKSRALNLNSSKMVETLANYNIVPNKSHSIHIDYRIPNKYRMDFLRGVFDGDGTVYIHKKHRQILSEIYSGSEKFINDLKKICGDIGKIRIRYKSGYENPIYVLVFNQTESVKLRDLLYRNGGFCLKRKQSVFYTKIEKNSRFWKDEDKTFLIKNHNKMSKKQLSNKLGRSIKSIDIAIRRFVLGKNYN